MFVTQQPPQTSLGLQAEAQVHYAGGAVAAAPLAAPQNRFSIPEYRARLTAIYSVHKPENLAKVEHLLAKYAGNEEFLYQTACQKYGVDTNFDPNFPLASSGRPEMHQPPPPPMQPPPPPQQQPPRHQAPSPQPRAAKTQPAPSQEVKTMEWDSATGQMVSTTVDMEPWLMEELGITQAAPAAAAEPARPPARRDETHGPSGPREVMEWDSASGKMVATSVEIEPWMMEELGITQAPAPAPAAEPVVVEEDEEDEDDYDPFSTSPEQSKQKAAIKDPLETLVQIDALVLGEPSYFFEKAAGRAAPAAATQAPARAEGRAGQEGHPVDACDGPAAPLEVQEGPGRPVEVAELAPHAAAAEGPLTGTSPAASSSARAPDASAAEPNPMDVSTEMVEGATSSQPLGQEAQPAAAAPAAIPQPEAPPAEPPPTDPPQPEVAEAPVPMDVSEPPTVEGAATSDDPYGGSAAEDPYLRGPDEDEEML